jgi:putative transcriptional regulator
MAKVSYNRIKVVLAEKNITGRELARHLAKTETTVSRWCTNDSQPPIEGLYQIARFLQVEITDLLVPMGKIQP